MMNGVSKPFNIGCGKCVSVEREGVRLPNGLYIRYNDLRLNEEGKRVYTSRRGVNNIWGGSMVENVVQALARIVVGEQMVMLHSLGLRSVLTVHDAAVIVVPDEEVESALSTVTRVMSTAPAWATGLPVACEAKFGKTYGDC
jgi:DNA polymerase I-like protein with 3'-5' exonuclease and polymerase domains